MHDNVTNKRLAYLYYSTVSFERRALSIRSLKAVCTVVIRVIKYVSRMGENSSFLYPIFVAFDQLIFLHIEFMSSMKQKQSNGEMDRKWI